MPDRKFEYEAAFEELSGVDRGVSTVPYLWTGSAKRLAEHAKKWYLFGMEGCGIATQESDGSGKRRRASSQKAASL